MLWNLEMEICHIYDSVARHVPVDFSWDDNSRAIFHGWTIPGCDISRLDVPRVDNSLVRHFPGGRLPGQEFQLRNFHLQISMCTIQCCKDLRVAA